MLKSLCLVATVFAMTACSQLPTQSNSQVSKVPQQQTTENTVQCYNGLYHVDECQLLL